MKEDSQIKVKYPEIGVCGLSCRLCPNYHMNTKSRCLGCKSKDRIVVGCPFITCAVKKRRIEFCWDCKDKKLVKSGKNIEKKANNTTLSNVIKPLKKIFPFLKKTELWNLKNCRRLKNGF
ncbi:DUF3795 domain-containing protein [Syntrophomonas wolfei]|jgi:hypothetical protein|uniref:DUF3795 domain-containing protein n=1 Tax=Syntrophomonas wolfei TaxID=863 RepID=UPI0023F1A84F|nr:DUF3795 domain-containing protein [Syntrophomonas wolfei]